MTSMPAVRIRDLSVAYRKRFVLDRVSFDLAPGKFHGLIGPNGAGKSTLLKAVTGLIPVTGSIAVNGVEVSAMSARSRALAMAYLAQDVPAPAEFTGREVAELGRYARLGRFASHTRADAEAVERALEITGALPWADRIISLTSGGERQLTNFARTLAQDAPLLLLDEPASALDMGHQLDVLELVRPWIRHGLGIDGAKPGLSGAQRTVIAVMHDLNEAARFCTDLTLLAPVRADGSGGVLAQGTPAEVLTPDLLATAYRVRVDVRPNPATGMPTVTPLGRT